jgi:casein kinase I family protein HRR25
MTCTHSYLEHEVQQYDRLGAAPGIPKKIWYGCEGEYRFLILELLGDDLHTIFTKFRPWFGPVQVAALAIQMIERLKYIHSKGLIHCDIKPANFTFTVKENDKVEIHLIDFAFARRWSEEQRKEKFEGTLYFSSVNASRGLGLSRRDDIESLAYVLLWLLRADALPWHSVLSSSLDQQRFPPDVVGNMVASLKEDNIPQNLPRDLPDLFAQFLVHARALAFDEEPDYSGYIEKFRQLAMDLYIAVG